MRRTPRRHRATCPKANSSPFSRIPTARQGQHQGRRHPVRVRRLAAPLRTDHGKPRRRACARKTSSSGLREAGRARRRIALLTRSRAGVQERRRVYRQIPSHGQPGRTNIWEYAGARRFRSDESCVASRSKADGARCRCDSRRDRARRHRPRSVCRHRHDDHRRREDRTRMAGPSSAIRFLATSSSGDGSNTPARRHGLKGRI